MKRTATVRSLANEGLMDADEALLALWEAGVHNVKDADEGLTSSQVREVRHALSLPKGNAVRRITYWQDVLSMTREQFTIHVHEIAGIHISSQASTLPKGVVKKLRRYHAERQSTQVARRRIESAASPDPVAEQEALGLVEWRTIGQGRAIRHLNGEEIERVHSRLTREFIQTSDPITPRGVKSHELLESAAYHPQTSIGQQPKYPSAEMAAAALLYAIAHNHAFHNGNKRTALVAFLAFLERNGRVVTCTQDELFQFVVTYTQHGLSRIPGRADPDYEKLRAARWVEQNTRQLRQGEQVLQWRELKPLLRKYDVEFINNNKGNSIRLERSVTTVQRSWFRTRQKNESLTFTTRYAGEGTEVSRHQVSEIRTALHLDEVHGVDHDAFYNAEAPIDVFVARYRKILYRLAKL